MNGRKAPRRMRYSIESRLRVVRLIEEGVAPSVAAAAAGASRASAYRWWRRFQQAGWEALADRPPVPRRQQLSTRSHGESFLAVLRHRFADVGVYFMDEPEAAFSFRSCLALVALLDQMRSEGSQVIVATHWPLIASLPGAALIEVGEWGLRRVERYDDLDLVESWRTFMAQPDAYLRHLLAG